MTTFQSGMLLFIVIVLAIIGLPRLAWAIRKPFFILNYAQWWLDSPLRHLLRNTHSVWPRRLFFLLSPLWLVYNLAFYLILIPLRLVNAFYFDVVLFWSISLRDGLADLVAPRYPTAPKSRYILKWVSRFPVRLARLIYKYSLVMLQGVAMLAFDLVWPTLTLFHGTGKEVAEKIAQTGEWLIGSGDYAGTGIYFGLTQEIAEHYAHARAQPLIVIARVSLAPCRSIATLRKEIRDQIGKDGDAISQEIQFPWVSLEHWRKDCSWYEFCLVQTEKHNRVFPWRVRPICVVSSKGPERVTGGLANWPRDRRGFTILGFSLLPLLIITLASCWPPAVRFVQVDQIWQRNLPVVANLTRESSPNDSMTLQPTPLAAGYSLPGSTPPACPAAPAIRLVIGHHACVTDLDGNILRLRANPSAQTGKILARLKPKTILDVLEGPQCAESFSWWKVSSIDGATGWAAEGDLDSYYLKPCP